MTHVKHCLLCGKSYSIAGMRQDKAKSRKYCSVSCRNTAAATGNKNHLKRKNSPAEKLSIEAANNTIGQRLNAVLFAWMGVAL